FNQLFESLSLQHVDWFANVGGAEVLCEGGVLFADGLVHFPGDAAVGDVSLGGGAEFGDVEGFGEIHFEERAFAGGERQCVLRGFGVVDGEFGVGSVGGVDGLAVAGGQARLGAGFFEVRRKLVAVAVGVVLQDLNAAAVAVHV